MKKILLVLTVLFLSVSSSFAYRQSVTLECSWQCNGQDIRINSNCRYLKITADWNNAIPGACGYIGSQDLTTYEYVADYFYQYDGSSTHHFEIGNYNSQYWNTVVFYIESFYSHLTATLEWDTI